jgi:hypothetical protein
LCFSFQQDRHIGILLSILFIIGGKERGDGNFGIRFGKRRNFLVTAVDNDRTVTVRRRVTMNDDLFCIDIGDPILAITGTPIQFRFDALVIAQCGIGNFNNASRRRLGLPE